MRHVESHSDRTKSACIALGMAFTATTASATQFIPQVQYSNDSIDQGGVPQACIVTAAMINPPAPEMVNLQFLVIHGNGAYKVTAGDIDWNANSSAAARIAAANFSTAQFNHPNAFRQSITPEGQLLSVLIDDSLSDAFMQAFFKGHYSIEFTRPDNPDTHTYYVEQGPSKSVMIEFQRCLAKAYNSLPPD